MSAIREYIDQHVLIYEDIMSSNTYAIDRDNAKHLQQNVKTKRQIFHSHEGYLTEVDSFTLFLQIVLNQENMILTISCDLNNNQIFMVILLDNKKIVF